jgi:CheY-like chemotaxis protein
MPNVLIVAYEPSLADVLARILSSDFTVTLARTSADALEHLASGTAFDVVLCELDMPGINGAELFERTRTLLPDASARFVFMRSDGTQAPSPAHAQLEAMSDAPLESPLDVTALWLGGPAHPSIAID